MKIIIIDHEPYNERKRKLYYMDDFIKEGIDVEFWSVVNCMPYQKGIQYPDSDYKSNSDVIYIEKYDELIKKITTLNMKETIVVLEIYFHWSTIIVFRTLNKLKINYIIIDYYLNILTAFSQSNNYKKIFTDFSYKNLKKWIKNTVEIKLLTLIDRFLKIKKNKILFLTGSLKQNAFTKCISLNYFDVEDNNNVNCPSIVNNKYIVFLDTNLPSHPDFFRDRLETITPETYYKKINHFFDLVEQKTGYKIVIAAHPHSEYTTEYKNRSSIKGKTALLVKHCEFVMLHESFSLNFALLNNKPAVFIYTEEFKKNKNYLKEIYKRMENLSTYLRIPIINIEKDDISFPLNFNQNKYSEYLYNYVYSSQYPKRNFEIIKEEIFRLLKPL